MSSSLEHDDGPPDREPSTTERKPPPADLGIGIADARAHRTRQAHDGSSLITATPGSGRLEQAHLNVTLPLPADTRAPATARTLVAAHAAFLGIERCEAATLLVSELVTNAVLHGGPEITLHVLTSRDTVRVEVHDNGAPMSPGTPPPAGATSVGGRGLVIVAAFATSWGFSPAHQRPGKCVWFELRASAPADRVRSRS